MTDMKSTNSRDERSTADSPVDSDVLDLCENASDPVYTAKATVLNNAIQDIGMGKYQWQLFFVVGFGWASGKKLCIV